MKNKLHSIKSNVAASPKYQLIFLVETWLDDNIFDSELKIPGYYFIRLDRNFILFGKSRAGGLIVYVRNGIGAKILHSQNYGIEQLILKFTFNNLTMLATLLYIPPVSSSLHDNLITAMLELTNSVSQFCNTDDSIQNILLLGDFNLPVYNWFQDNELQNVIGYN